MLHTLKNFDAIWLTELNATMSLMDRIEYKYIVHISDLEEILKDFQDDYFALEIHKIRQFIYDNVYFDTKQYAFFHEHGKGYKMRTKLRTRKYVDSKISFFEFKQRYYENIRKFRFDIKNSKHGVYTKKAEKFTQKLYLSTYQKKLKSKPSPSIKTTYTRFTLCSKNNDERITFDTKVTFKDLRNKKTRPVVLWDIVLVESKSSKQEHKATDVLKKRSIVAMNWISKYCIWTTLLWITKTKYKRFETIISHIQKLQMQG